MSEFLALPHYYKWQFLYFEPFSTVLTTVLIWGRPGAAWFMHGLGNNPDTAPILPLTTSAELALWQLANCYLLLGLLSSFVFRAVRNALPGNPVAQERIVGASLFALAIADITHILVTFIKLAPHDRYSPGQWNSNIHGNITFTIYLFLSRMAWFAGIGRRRYFYGQRDHSKML